MLVTLEGLDGSGKSSCLAALEDAPSVPAATYTREPTHTWYGNAVRRSLNDDAADPLAELFLFTADHAAHLADVVRPALSRGELVVSDRYSDSRYAYQGATLADRLDDPVGFVRELHQPWTRPPDATVYLDVDPETAARRSGATNKFERIDYLERVRDNYEQLIAAEPDRFVRVDATEPPAVVTERVAETIVDLTDSRE